MCIPTNREVKNSKDVQYIITDAILRKGGLFTREDIYKEVEEKLKFSAFGKFGRRRKDVSVKKMIDDTFSAFLRSNYITYNFFSEKYIVY